VRTGRVRQELLCRHSFPPRLSCSSPHHLLIPRSCRDGRSRRPPPPLDPVVWLADEPALLAALCAGLEGELAHAGGVAAEAMAHGEAAEAGEPQEQQVRAWVSAHAEARACDEVACDCSVLCASPSLHPLAGACAGDVEDERGGAHRERGGPAQVFDRPRGPAGEGWADVAAMSESALRSASPRAVTLPLSSRPLTYLSLDLGL